jgi:long-chain fatty acid transport protein
MPRGTQPSARAGASVAGSDNPHALWYNPAGLLASERQLLVDAVTPIFRAEFTRVLDNGIVEPTVESLSAIPIPTIAYSDDFGLEHWGFGIGLIVPPGGGAEWPEEVDGRPAPQRYSILDSGGSAIASLALGAAYEPIDRLVIGAAVYLTAAQVGGTVAFSACDYVVCSQPEAVEWQGRTRFLLGPLFTATAVFGVTYALPEMVKFGASLQLPTKLAGDAALDLELPDSRIFDGITAENAQGGDDLKAGMEMLLPLVVRLGVEVQPLEPLKVELAGTWENWSAQEKIEIRPRNIIARGVPGIGDIAAEPVELALNMRDTWAVSLGGSYDFSRMTPRQRAFVMHAGAMYETGAFADAYLSPTTLDTQKILLGLGASVGLGRGVYLDASYGHIFMQNRDIRNSKVLLPAAIKPVPVDDDPGNYEVGDRPAIGNGVYEMEADYFGLAVRWMLDPHWRASQPSVAPVTGPPPAPPQEPALPAPEPERVEATDVSASALPATPPVEPPSYPAPLAPSPAEPAASESSSAETTASSVPAQDAAASPEDAAAAQGGEAAPEAPAGSDEQQSEEASSEEAGAPPTSDPAPPASGADR